MALAKGVWSVLAVEVSVQEQIGSDWGSKGAARREGAAPQVPAGFFG
jgi:hypothetical protein